METTADSIIRENVKHEIEWDPQISSDDIAAVVKEGVVALSGYASSYMEKNAAENAAKRVQGVRAVANDLRVNSAAQLTDPEIARDIVADLENHALIPSKKLTISVRDGWVTLDGMADWQYQKQLAESIIKSLRGVIGITNNISIKPKVSTTDVKSEITEALQRDAVLDAGRLTVEADGTIVKLSGTVRSWAERDEAERAAWSAPGVTQVDNRIIVAS